MADNTNTSNIPPEPANMVQRFLRYLRRLHLRRNIRPEPPHIVWDNADPARSLQELREAVELEGQKAIEWYWQHKKWKRRWAQLFQFLALFLTASAGLVPILLQVLTNFKVNTAWMPKDSGPLAAVFVGIAAALLGLDKAFGFSSGWVRYVLTATSMTKLLEEFRMDWIALSAVSAVPPTADQQSARIQRAKQFVSTIQGMVEQETKDWATEFQSNIAQMEKDLKVQLDTLKAQVDKAAKDKEVASKPGAIELTVTNADKTDAFSFDVVLEGQSGKSTDSVSNAMVWTRINVVPGQYKIGINAKSKGNLIATSTVITVNPGETAKPSVTLPI
jgi:hypothetical protein